MAATSLTLLISLISSLFLLLLYLHSIRRRRRSDEQLDDPIGVSRKPEVTEAEAEAETGAEAEAAVDEVQKGDDKRRKKRGRKKRPYTGGESDGRDELNDRSCAYASTTMTTDSKDCVPFPFSSFGSATQRKIKLQYDQLIKSNQSRALTLSQVGQFVNCLVDVKNDLQHKSETIKRSFKIKKALLFKADRSSFDRLCREVHKLEAEHKRLEEDVTVYNLLQEQIKVSPAYKRMLEISASMELNATLDQEMESCDISFEELLAQEKKDSFWQRNGKHRSIAG